MNIGKYVAEGMILVGAIGTTVSFCYSLHLDQIDKGIRSKITNAEREYQHIENLRKLDKTRFSESYNNATEEEIKRLEEQYQKQIESLNLPSLRRQLNETRTFEGLESIGLLASGVVLLVGLAKRFPEKKKE